jgi:dTDP-4-amino-4,6-dideoxygalactose transaminase
MTLTIDVPPTRIPILDLSAQVRQLHDTIMEAIEGVVASQSFILGPNVQAFEREIAEYCGVKHAVGVASGTDALILALRAAGVGPGDEVIVPAFSFIATADAVSLLGARPVFADVEPGTLNLDVASAQERVSERTKAILPVHLYGQPAAMEEILALAGEYTLTVIEDCAQALGARYATSKVATLGDYGCISFFPSKNLGAFGDGGMIVTDDAEAADHLRRLRSHGSKRKYHSEEQGWNSRLDELQAAILRVKLPHLDAWNAARGKNAEVYDALLGTVEGVEVLRRSDRCEPVFHQYTIRVQHRDAVQQALSRDGVQTCVYYPIPLHLQPMYRDLGYRSGDLPIAERAAAEVLSLPMFPELTEAQMVYVADSLRRAIRENSRAGELTNIGQAGG